MDEKIDMIRDKFIEREIEREGNIIKFDRKNI